MLSANKEKLQSYFMGANQFIIPFFQRSYVWDSKNWLELWENIINVKNKISEGKTESEHFIGTIIIKQSTKTERLGALEYDLIDGQQRLTTICILLRALHDVSNEDSLKKWIFDLLISRDSYGNENIRILHSKVDKKYFEQVILDKECNNLLYNKFNEIEEIKQSKENGIKQAYCFFRKQIIKELVQEDIRSFAGILLERLPVIHMALSKDDDVQQIFDTINSLGVRLTTAELLKNHLYAYKNVASKYKEYWEDVFEADEDAINFWNENKTSGRIMRTTIELFLYSYLVIIKEGTVRMESLFKEFKDFLKDKTAEERLEFAKDLSEYGQLYSKIPDGKNLGEIMFNEHDKRFFHVIQGLENTTILPLVLYIYKRVDNELERNKILRIFESYLIRRAICKLTTKNYNNLFISILKDMKKEPVITADIVKQKLMSYEDDSNRVPNDEDFKTGFYSSHLVNKYTSEILYCIALYQICNEFQDSKKLSLSNLSLEHMMPKKWRNNWPLEEGEDEFQRDSILLTLGNLTLVTGKLNSSMRDSPWKNKKEALRKNSSLRITTDYIHTDIWNENEILNRVQSLFEYAKTIWNM